MMEIIIKSRENGWETVRHMELPEDDGLVKSILRSVKRRLDAAAEREAEDANEQEVRRGEQESVQEVQAVAGQDQKPFERTVFEIGIKGFIHVTCKQCGKIYITNAKNPIKESRCRACGHITALDDVTTAEMFCPVCNRTWRYKTNSEDAEVSADCVVCGYKMASRWNSKLRRYMPYGQVKVGADDGKE